jgi:hypothetical protein
VSIDPKYAHLADLVLSAMESPDEESEMIGSDGTGLRITKYPEPGVRMRMVPIGGEAQGLTITMREARCRWLP